MNTFAYRPHCWSTASKGLVTDTSAIDLLTLGEHLDHCQSGNRHLRSLHCAAQNIRGFMAARIVTTVMLVVVILGANLWLL